MRWHEQGLLCSWREQWWYPGLLAKDKWLSCGLPDDERQASFLTQSSHPHQRLTRLCLLSHWFYRQGIVPAKHAARTRIHPSVAHPGGKETCPKICWGPAAFVTPSKVFLREPVHRWKGSAGEGESMLRAGQAREDGDRILHARKSTKSCKAQLWATVAGSCHGAKAWA